MNSPISRARSLTKRTNSTVYLCVTCNALKRAEPSYREKCKTCNSSSWMKLTRKSFT